MAVTEDLIVLLGIGADTVQVHAAVKLLLTVRAPVRVDPPRVVESLAARQPADAGVSAAIDWPFDLAAAVDFHNVQSGFLVAAPRQLVGEQFRLPGRRI